MKTISKKLTDFFLSLPFPPLRLSCSPHRSEQLLFRNQLGERELSITLLHRRRLKQYKTKNPTNAFCWEKENKSSPVSDVLYALLLVFVQRLKFNFGAFGCLFAFVVLLLPKPEQQGNTQHKNVQGDCRMVS